MTRVHDLTTMLGNVFNHVFYDVVLQYFSARKHEILPDS